MSKKAKATLIIKTFNIEILEDANSSSDLRRPILRKEKKILNIFQSNACHVYQQKGHYQKVKQIKELIMFKEMTIDI